MSEKLGIIKELDYDLIDGPPQARDKDRPEVIYLRQAHSIMVIVKGKKYLYNIHDIPSR